MKKYIAIALVALIFAIYGVVSTFHSRQPQGETQKASVFHAPLKGEETQIEEDFHYRQMREEAQRTNERMKIRNITDLGATIAIGDWRGCYDLPKNLNVCESYSCSNTVGLSLYDYQKVENNEWSSGISVRGLTEDYKCNLHISYPYLDCSLNKEQMKEISAFYQELIDTSIRERGDATFNVVNQKGKKHYSIKFPEKVVEGDIVVPPKPDVVLKNPFEKLIEAGDCKWKEKYEQRKQGIITDNSVTVSIGKWDNWDNFHNFPQKLIACEPFVGVHPTGWPLYGYQDKYVGSGSSSQVDVRKLFTERNGRYTECSLDIMRPHLRCYLDTEQLKTVSKYYEKFIRISKEENGYANLHIVKREGKKHYSIKFPKKPDIVLENPFEKLIENGSCEISLTDKEVIW